MRHVIIATIMISGGAIVASMVSGIPGLKVDGAIGGLWYFVGLFAGLAAYALYMRDRLDALTDHDALSVREHARLERIIQRRQTEILAILSFYVFSSVFILVVSLLSKNGWQAPGYLPEIVGGIIAFAIYLVFVVWSDLVEVRAFKAKLDRKAKRRKQKKELLGYMDSSDKTHGIPSH